MKADESCMKSMDLFGHTEYGMLLTCSEAFSSVVIGALVACFHPLARLLIFWAQVAWI